MTTRKYSSRSQQTTLSAGISAVDATATVVSGANLLASVAFSPAGTFTVVIDPDTALEEIVDVTGRSGNVLDISRGIENGGTGVAVSISGSSVTYAGGGGGNVLNGTAGSGGPGGGGAGGATTGNAGTVNTGGGGGAQGNTGSGGGAGGSGIVILRYPTASGTITIGAGLTGTTATDGSNTVATITAGTGNVCWA